MVLSFKEGEYYEDFGTIVKYLGQDVITVGSTNQLVYMFVNQYGESVIVARWQACHIWMTRITDKSRIVLYGPS